MIIIIIIIIKTATTKKNLLKLVPVESENLPMWFPIRIWLRPIGLA